MSCADRHAARVPELHSSPQVAIHENPTTISANRIGGAGGRIACGIIMKM